MCSPPSPSSPAQAYKPPPDIDISILPAYLRSPTNRATGTINTAALGAAAAEGVHSTGAGSKPGTAGSVGQGSRDGERAGTADSSRSGLPPVLGTPQREREAAKLKPKAKGKEALGPAPVGILSRVQVGGMGPCMCA